jgi:hypothetical protein
MSGEQIKTTTQADTDTAAKTEYVPATPLNAAEANTPIEAQPVATAAEIAAASTNNASTHQAPAGWLLLPEEELPKATYWPVIMGLAITLIVFGIITTIIITIVGFILFAVSLIGWIGDVQNEKHGHH